MEQSLQSEIDKVRLIGNIHFTKGYRQFGHVGDQVDTCKLCLFQYASFESDLHDSKATSGGVLCMFGDRTVVPISWMCKMQTADSHSNSEVDVISLDARL